MFAAAMFVATFMYTLVASPTVHAATDADWNGDTITYFGNTYEKIDTAKTGDSHNLPAGTLIYRYIEPNASSPSSPTTKAHLIYFAPGTDPTKETSATYITYDYTPPNTYKNPFGKTTISLAPQNPVSPGTTSCAVEGIGWIICPVTNFLASAMDHLFDILAGFLTVRPAQTNQENALYRAWSVMRNFANIVFVIAFLVVIYSQITTIGLSNYDIKKMLPKLIIAAILVNVSYWICAIAIDLSNIAGYSIQEIFISIRNNLVGTEGNSWDVFSWKSVGGLVLSGGTAAAAAGFGAYGLLLSAGAVSGALYMLLPILVGVIVAVLVALLVMAARQAIITILFIVSPLAFVAYLLPNTEQYFKKWHELGTTMLVLFPIFSFIFGGSQLAGMAIIQNADSFNLIILGMGVQVAPVVITPLLVRFSGSLVARIGGIVNNPGKGLIDRTRKFAEERRDQRKAALFASPLNRRRDAVARLGRRVDTNKRTREGWQKANEAMADARWANNHNAHQIHGASEEAKILHDTGEAIGQAAFNRLRTTDGHRVQVGDVNLRVAKLDVDVSEATANAQWENLRAAPSALNTAPGHLTEQARLAREQTIGSSVVARQIHSAQHEQQQDFSRALQASDALQTEAGGIAEHGADSALASAIAAQRKAYNEAVGEADQIIKHLNLSSAQRQDLALGNRVEIRDPSSGTLIKAFDSDSLYAREAAIDFQVKNGTVKEAEEIIGLSGSTLSGFRTTISQAVAQGGIGPKTVYMGGQTIDLITRGVITSPAKLTGVIQDNIAKGKISADKLATIDKDAVESILRAARQTDTSQMDPTLVARLAPALAELKANANYALNDDLLKGKVQTNVKPLLQDMITYL
jgi:hypothetical protein